MQIGDPAVGLLRRRGRRVIQRGEHSYIDVPAVRVIPTLTSIPIPAEVVAVAVIVGVVAVVDAQRDVVAIVLRHDVESHGVLTGRREVKLLRMLMRMVIGVGAV